MTPARKPASKQTEAERPEVDEGAEAAEEEWEAQPPSQPAQGVDPTEASANPYPASQVSPEGSQAPIGGVRSEEQERADAEAAAQQEAERAEAEEEGGKGGRRQAAAGSRPGPAVIDGPFGTTVDSADPSLGKLRVEVRSNVTLGNRLLTVDRRTSVPDDAEARGAIAVGHLRLLDEDEPTDDES